MRHSAKSQTRRTKRIRRNNRIWRFSDPVGSDSLSSPFAICGGTVRPKISLVGCATNPPTTRCWPGRRMSAPRCRDRRRCPRVDVWGIGGSTPATPTALGVPVTQRVARGCPGKGEARPSAECATEPDRVENARESAHACNGDDPPELIASKISRHDECITSRQRINRICFKGEMVRITIIFSRDLHP